MAQELRETEAKLQEALNTANITEAVKCLRKINEEGWEVQIDYIPASSSDLSKSSKSGRQATSRSKIPMPNLSRESLHSPSREAMQPSDDSDTQAGSKSVSVEEGQGIGRMPPFSFNSSSSAVQLDLVGESALIAKAFETSSDQSARMDSSRR